ncbi:MAG: tRNA dihydrouridine synthase DusB [Actinomycetota bacterium]|nr:tRNA dihydrouridine synthase DusB [Actinomycetota bacterium]
MELRLGSFVPAAPVVLAPMAGVTDAPFRSLCRGFAPDLVYVNEMMMSSAVVHGNDKTRRMMSFGPDEHPRSLQLYGSDPAVVRQAVSLIGDCDLADHIDLNFGCPAAKVTRKGGGAAVPAHPDLLRAIVRAAVEAASPFGIPVTAKFRMGLTDDLLTHLRTGEICAEEGVVAIALHARTAEQHYAGDARWEAIAELTAHVPGLPVLGNGDIWEADDALAMLRATGCHGVVIGRGCLGRPWLFEDLVRRFDGQAARPARALGAVATVMAHHAALLAAHNGESIAMRQFRKHSSWYLAGYPVGAEARRSLGMVSSSGELEDLLGALDPDAVLVPGGERVKRGHTNGPIKVALPEGYLDHIDDMTVPDDGHVMVMSGG